MRLFLLVIQLQKLDYSEVPGVNSLVIRGIPLAPNQPIDVLVRRNSFSQQIQIWLRPSNAFGKWQPYQEQLEAA